MKKYTYLFLAFLITSTVIAQDTPVASDTSKGNRDVKVDVERTCKLAFILDQEMERRYSYGEFSAFEVIIMQNLANIPYKELPVNETRQIFSDYWNTYLLGETREGLCLGSYSLMSLTTGTVLRWIIETDNEKLFDRLTDPKLFSIDINSKSNLDNRDIQGWLVGMLSLESIQKTRVREEKYKKYLAKVKALNRN